MTPPTPLTKADLSKPRLKTLWYANQGWKLHYNCLGLGMLIKGGESHKAHLMDIMFLMNKGLVFRTKGDRDYGDYELTDTGRELAKTIEEGDL